MEWEKPSYVEINMSAEIGGYQEDEFQEREPVSAGRLEQAKVHVEMNQETHRMRVHVQPLAVRQV
jgi:hypothetical protein